MFILSEMLTPGRPAAGRLLNGPVDRPRPPPKLLRSLECSKRIGRFHRCCTAIASTTPSAHCGCYSSLLHIKHSPLRFFDWLKKKWRCPQGADLPMLSFNFRRIHWFASPVDLETNCNSCHAHLRFRVCLMLLCARGAPSSKPETNRRSQYLALRL